MRHHLTLKSKIIGSFLTFLLILSGAAMNALSLGSRVFDSEKGIFLDNQYIMVLKNRIVSVDASIKNPKDANIIDLGKYTVLPGLIDCHTHRQKDSLDSVNFNT